MFNKQFHQLVQITRPMDNQFYWARCAVCRKYGLYKDIRQQVCEGR